MLMDQPKEVFRKVLAAGTDPKDHSLIFGRRGCFLEGMLVA